eukprot:TRINITY_DN5364_c0_g1_i1.p1 TRINITY_DN5364_c0_g1~~TRINITY_DN5364_c0_g1_i1.p1  ORF type:complete len:221 (-),score=46.24 TRINITY_DN5364_c0_g1_i1:70-732(-)
MSPSLSSTLLLLACFLFVVIPGTTAVGYKGIRWVDGHSQYPHYEEVTEAMESACTLRAGFQFGGMFVTRLDASEALAPSGQPSLVEYKITADRDGLKTGLTRCNKTTAQPTLPSPFKLFKYVGPTALGLPSLSAGSSISLIKTIVFKYVGTFLTDEVREFYFTEYAPPDQNPERTFASLAAIGVTTDTYPMAQITFVTEVFGGPSWLCVDDVEICGNFSP